MVGACVGCLYMVSAFIAPRQYKSAWFAFFFFRRSALLWPFFLFYLRTWVQQQQLESTATLKAQERSSSAQREVQIRDPCVCRCFCFFRFCHLRFPLLWRSGGFSCWLRSLWRERYLLCSAKKRKEGLTFRDKQERAAPFIDRITREARGSASRSVVVYTGQSSNKTSSSCRI